MKSMDLFRLARRVASPPLVYYSGPGSSSEYFKSFSHLGTNVGIFYTPKTFYNYSDHHDMAYNPIPVDEFKKNFDERMGSFSEEDADFIRDTLAKIRHDAVNIWCYDHRDYSQGSNWILHDCFHNYFMNQPGANLWDELFNADSYRDAFFADFRVDAAEISRNFSEPETVVNRKILDTILNWNSGRSYFDLILGMLPENLKALGASTQYPGNRTTFQDHFADLLPIFFNPESEKMSISLDYRAFAFFRNFEGRYSITYATDLDVDPGRKNKFVNIVPTGKRETEAFFRTTVEGVKRHFEAFLKNNVGKVVLGSA